MMCRVVPHCYKIYDTLLVPSFSPILRLSKRKIIPLSLGKKIVDDSSGIGAPVGILNSETTLLTSGIGISMRIAVVVVLIVIIVGMTATATATATATERTQGGKSLLLLRFLRR